MEGLPRQDDHAYKKLASTSPLPPLSKATAIESTSNNKGSALSPLVGGGLIGHTACLISSRKINDTTYDTRPGKGMYYVLL